MNGDLQRTPGTSAVRGVYPLHPPAAPGALTGKAAGRQPGFTLIELIVVIIIIGILAAIGGPRFFGNHAFAERGYADEIAAALRSAQKIAVATGCPVSVAVDASGYQAQQRIASGNHCANAGAWTTPAVRADGSPLAGQTPADANVAATSQFEFNAAGRLAGAAASIQVGVFTVSVAGASGFVEVQ